MIGTSYSEHALSYIKENPNATCTSLLEDFAGKAEDIWTGDSINKSRYILAGTYVLNLPLFIVCIIGVVQALSCGNQ